MNAGATPKLITSVKESNSLPTLDVPFMILAIRPSRPSIMAAIIIATIGIIIMAFGNSEENYLVGFVFGITSSIGFSVI